MRLRLSTLTFVSLLLVCPAVGADDSYFVTVKLGSTSLDRVQGQGPLDIVRSDPASWVAGFGYRLNRHLAFQAEYLDFGVVDHTPRCGPPDSFCASAPPRTLETDGLSVSVVPQWPLSRHASVFGKLGLARLKTRASSLGQTESELEDDEVHYGAGVRLQVWPRLSLLAEYDAVGNDVSSVSLGASFAF